MKVSPLPFVDLEEEEEKTLGNLYKMPTCLFFSEETAEGMHYIPNIGDFGLAAFPKELTVEGKQFSNIVGFSVRYAAPEVFENAYLPADRIIDIELESKVDCYAFSIMVFEMVCFLLQESNSQNSRI